jgi:hypothetical protein
MQKLSKDQMLISLNGIVNGGKTLVFDLIKKEDNFIHLDISKYHYNFYKDIMIEQIGEESVLRLEPFIKNDDFFNPQIFTREIGSIMRKFPNYNFVIKPVDDIISCRHNKKDKEWMLYCKKYMPIKEENMHFLFIIRHPKLCWVTSYKLPFDEMIRPWSFDLKIRLEHTELVKIEELEKNKLLKRIIKKTDLSKVRAFTEFDFNKTERKDFDNIDDEIKQIEKAAINNYKLLGYDLEDKNVSLFMKEREEFLKNWRKQNEKKS